MNNRRESNVAIRIEDFSENNTKPSSPRNKRILRDQKSISGKKYFNLIKFELNAEITVFYI